MISLLKIRKFHDAKSADWLVGAVTSLHCMQIKRNCWHTLPQSITLELIDQEIKKIFLPKPRFKPQSLEVKSEHKPLCYNAPRDT